MHVYGWPIIAKVASLEWSNRGKHKADFQSVKYRVSKSEVDGSKFGGSKVSLKDDNQGFRPSYVDVLKDKIGKSKDREDNRVKRLGLPRVDKSNECYNKAGVERENFEGTGPIMGYQKSGRLKNIVGVGVKCLTNNDKGISPDGGRSAELLNKGKGVMVRVKPGRPHLPFVSNAAINLEK
ncbi:hypothetical protein Q3G72_029919 [Acer saccharum]|nr:hypothetical protein Q3G72_029919 [Acer saccharum]